MGFSSEQLVRWVAERTDIHVSVNCQSRLILLVFNSQIALISNVKLQYIISTLVPVTFLDDVCHSLYSS